jgi:hypothetical protein
MARKKFMVRKKSKSLPRSPAEQTEGRWTPDGLLFGPTSFGTACLSMFAHCGGGSKKYRNHLNESIEPLIEYGIFVTAEQRDWRAMRASIGGC